ncbi:MAG: FapA family protein [Oscillospiraceae bacterium]|jgi:uncharacterized protein (DUF342 family)|nr:FapA family protein [Oscillospiraceae bacterium]
MSPKNTAPKLTPRDAVVNVSVAKNNTEASIRVVEPADGGKEVTEKMILDALSAAKITHGINRAAISAFAARPSYGSVIVVAEGEQPVPGVKGELDYKFSSTRVLRPTIRPDGTADYRNLGYVQNVLAGQVLVERIPSVPGTPGKDVYGVEKFPPKTPEAILPKGKNTVISEDGLTLLASVDGQVDLNGRTVAILDMLTVENVDFSTGDIDFVGNVTVNGDIGQSARVKADGNVTVKGVVDGGSIEAKGNVVIQGGYNGRHSGVLRAEGSIKTKFIQNGTVHAKEIETSVILNSNVNAKDAIRVVGKGALVLASNLHARNTVECVNAGSESSRGDNLLEVGNDPDLLIRSRELPRMIVDIEKQLAQLDRLLDVFKQLRAANRLDEEKAEKARSVEVNRDELQERLNDLQIEREECDEALAKAGYGTIIVTGTLFPTAMILIGPERLRISDPVSFVRYYRREAEGIVTSTAK